VTTDPDLHHRRSIRLQGYDYSWPGAYFVTVCLKSPECLLGEVIGEEARLNDVGRMIKSWWVKLPVKYPTVGIDEFVIMPNHFHGIVVAGATPCGRPVPGQEPGQAHGPAPTHPPVPTLGDIVGWFKTMTTNEYIRGVKERGRPPFAGRFWQRNYYEHIIRNDDELNRIRDYIQMNPARWAWDRQNASAIPGRKPEAPWEV